MSNLLFYEFENYPNNSYNGRIGALVRKIGHYRSNVSGDEFIAAGPELRNLQNEIQRLDREFGGKETRNYIADIMEQFEAQDSIEEDYKQSVTRACKVIVNNLFPGNIVEFVLEDWNYEYSVIKSIPTVQFFGHNSNEQLDGKVMVVKDVFCSVCNQFNIIFINSLV